VEIKFRNSRDPRDDSRAFEEALLQIVRLYGIMKIVRLSERSASYARYYNYTIVITVRKTMILRNAKYVSQQPPLSCLVSVLIINIMLSVYGVVFIDLVVIRCHKLLRAISKA